MAAAGILRPALIAPSPDLRVPAAAVLPHPPPVLGAGRNLQGAPARAGASCGVRVGTELGFKMVKWLLRIELVDDYRAIGEGQGGSREDNMYYEQSVGI